MSGMQVLWVVLIILISAGLSWWQYQKQFKRQFKRAFLFAIPRFLAYICIGLLLLNPKIQQTSYYTENPNLIIGVDNSMSIAQLTDTTTFKSNIQKFIQDEDLNDAFDIQAYSFGENYKSLDTLNFEDTQTNISAFLQEMSKIYSSEESHIILFTDGQQTLGRDYVYSARASQKNTIPVVVGDTANYVDTKINRINANRYAFLNNRFPVEVFLSYNGKKNIDTEFLLKREGKILERKKLSFSKDKTTENFKIFLKAENIGVNTIKAELKPVDEKNTQNNTQEFAVEVIDERTKILLLYNKLHPDIGMLKKSITSNPQRQLELQKINNNTGDLATYNLIILYQPDASFNLALEFLDNQNLNYMVIGGTQTDYNFLNTKQNHFTKTLSNAEEDYYAEYNPGYSSYQFKDIDFENFPPLKNKFGDVNNLAEVDILLYQNIDGFATRQPLMMTVSDDNQKSAYVFGENMWRWRMRSHVESGDFKTFDRFLDQLVQFVSSNETKKRLVTDVKSFYNRGNKSIINVQYFDRNYNFDPNQKVTLEATNKETSKRYLYNLVLKNQNYTTKINDLPGGNYDYQISVKNQNLTDSGQFKIIDFVLEKSFYRADVEKLSQISDTFFYANQMQVLKNYLTTQQEFKPLQKSVDKKQSLVNWWVLLVLIIVFLSFEWFSRKYHGLI